MRNSQFLQNWEVANRVSKMRVQVRYVQKKILNRSLVTKNVKKIGKNFQMSAISKFDF